MGGIPFDQEGNFGRGTFLASGRGRGTGDARTPLERVTAAARKAAGNFIVLEKRESGERGFYASRRKL